MGTTDFRISNSVFSAKVFSISPGYWKAAGTHMVAARDFTWHDCGKAPKVAIVSENFVHRMFGNQLALELRFMFGQVPYEIVGIGPRRS
jgi:hypothetical protein